MTLNKELPWSMGLNDEPSDFMSDTPGNTVKRESVKLLDATPLNSISQS